MGETTQKIAQARPGDNFLGIEVFNAGVGALLKRIDESGPSNIRIIQHDAVEVARDMIAPNSLAGVHIYFPDPWPKKRHLATIRTAAAPTSSHLSTFSRKTDRKSGV